MAGRPGRSTPQPAAAPRKRKPGQNRRPGKPTVLGRVFARPGIIVAGATFAAVMTGIVANALLLQKGHHPSPLFNPPPAAVAATEPSQPAVPVPPPAPRQALEQPAAPPAVDAPAPTEVAPTPTPAMPASHPARKVVGHPGAGHAATSAHKAAPAAHPDLIGQLLTRQDGKQR